MTGFGNDNDEIDAELTRLFGDSRLDVPAKSDAGQTIVAGAQRIRRRRRALAGGAAAVVVAGFVAGGAVLGLSGPSGPDQIAGPGETVDPPANSAAPSRSRAAPSTPGPTQSPPPPDATQPSPPESPPPEETSTPEPPPIVMGAPFGPDGYGGLLLGMSYEEAAESGRLADATRKELAEGTCETFTLAEGSHAVGGVLISGSRGVVAFEASGARTPAGVGAGSTVDELRAAYPEATKTDTGFVVPAGERSRYSFAVTDGSVTALRLVASNTDC